MINNIELNLFVFVDAYFTSSSRYSDFKKRVLIVESDFIALGVKPAITNGRLKKVKMDFRRESHSILSLLPRQEMSEFS